MAFPEWVEKQKRTGYEIKEIRGNYYMYKLKSKWDPQKKRAKKVSGEYIGKVTPEGLIPKKPRIDKTAPVLSIEFGATAFLAEMAGDLLPALCERFEEDVAKRIWATAALRLISPCPFKRIALRYESSWLSRILPKLALSAASLSKLIDMVGADRAACAAFMRDTMQSTPCILIDGTNTVSKSEGIARALSGHAHGYAPQINQVYVVSVSDEGSMPAFYRNVAGNVPDVTALKLTVRDACIEDAILVGDAGFASEGNFAALKKEGLDYIIPLKRNTSEICLDKTEYETAFSYHHRPIMAHSVVKDGYRVCVFRDGKLQSDEMADFIRHAEKKNAKAKEKKKFDPAKDIVDVSAETIAKMPSFGTIILRTSLLEHDVQKVYETYKIRWEIEQLFDTMRNTVGQDTSSMQDDVGFEAWAFINHVTLIMACRILARIRSLGMTKDWSLAGVMEHLSHIHAVQIADEWQMAEIVGKTKKMLENLAIDLKFTDHLLPNH